MLARASSIASGREEVYSQVMAGSVEISDKRKFT
jgi:hypothetical protein